MNAFGIINVADREVRVHEHFINSPNILLFIQGSWAAYNQPCNDAATEAIVEAGIASVVRYESSRDWKLLDRARTREEWRAAFDGKTFEDELREARAVVDYVNEEHSPEGLFLSARSYGGSLGTLVAGDDIPNLSRVMLCSPQVFFNQDGDLSNIYQEAPFPDEIFESIAGYAGTLRIVSALYDKEEFRQGALALLHHAGLNHGPIDKKLIVLPTQHSLGDKLITPPSNPEELPEPNTFELYAQEHLDFFGN